MIFRVDLQAQYLAYRPEIDAAVARVLAGGRYTLGLEVEHFEREFASYLHATEVIGVADGTRAIVLALQVLGVRPGAEVITTPFTAIPTIGAIIEAGATPVLVDIDPDTYLIDLDQVAAPSRQERRPSCRSICSETSSTYRRCGSVSDRALLSLRMQRRRTEAASEQASRARWEILAPSASIRPRTSAATATAERSFAATRLSHASCGCCAITACGTRIFAICRAPTAGSTNCRRRSYG